MRWCRWILLAALAAWSAGFPVGLAAADQAGMAAAQPAVSGVPSLAHIAVVVMENRSESSIIGNPAAPYINSLAQAYTSLDAYSAVAHPSLPNYLALTGGDTFGITSDCISCFVPARNLSDLLSDAGISGKAYMEDMPQPCFRGSSGAYAQKHDPFIYYDDVRNDPARCQSIVPYGQMAADLASGTLPAFIWITPNLCHDMHDCDVASGDRWLAANLPPLLTSPAFSQQSSLLAIVWDEDDSASTSNRVPLILAGKSVKQGYVSHLPANHYSLLRTVEAAWNLPPLTANDASAQPISDAFQS